MMTHISSCRVNAGLAIILTALLGLAARAQEEVKYDFSLKAKPRTAAIAAGTVALVDLELTNTGQRKIQFCYHFPVERLAVLRTGVRFDLRQGYRSIPSYRPKDARGTMTSGTRIVSLAPGESWTAVGCINWSYPLDAPGDYTATAVLTLDGLFGASAGREPGVFWVSSNTFAITVKPVEAETQKARVQQLDSLLARKVTLDPEAVEAVMALAFSGTPDASLKLTGALIRQPRFVTELSLAALAVALDRLPDNAPALSNTHLLLGATDSRLKRLGVNVIATRGTPDDAVKLVALLDDKDYMVKYDACVALEKITDFRPTETDSKDEKRLDEIVRQAKAWWTSRAHARRG